MHSGATHAASRIERSRLLKRRRLRVHMPPLPSVLRSISSGKASDSGEDAASGEVLDLRQRCFLGWFKVLKTEKAYHQFHADVWRSRLRLFIGTLQLFGVVFTANELGNPRSADAGFRARVLEDFPEQALGSTAVTLFVRYIVVGLILASTYTRFDPLRKSYDAVACTIAILVVCAELLPPVVMVLTHDPSAPAGAVAAAAAATAARGHGDHAEHDETHWMSLAGTLGTFQISVSDLLTFAAAIIGMSPLAYLFASSVLVVTACLHFQVCWSHYFGEPVPSTAWPRVCIAVAGFVGTLSLDLNTRHLFVLHVRLQATIEQLSREKQRLAWDWQLLSKRKREAATASQDMPPGRNGPQSGSGSARQQSTNGVEGHAAGTEMVAPHAGQGTTAADAVDATLGKCGSESSDYDQELLTAWEAQDRAGEPRPALAPADESVPSAAEWASLRRDLAAAREELRERSPEKGRAAPASPSSRSPGGSPFQQHPLARRLAALSSRLLAADAQRAASQHRRRAEHAPPTASDAAPSGAGNPRPRPAACPFDHDAASPLSTQSEDSELGALPFESPSPAPVDAPSGILSTHMRL